MLQKSEISKLGPGIYDASPMKSTVSYTMGKKSESKVKNEIPGPGIYDPKAVNKETVKGFTFGKAPPKEKSLIPSRSTAMIGPGSYY